MALEPDSGKRCPDCAEPVREQARVCRFCGYRFDAPPAETPTQRRGIGRRRRESNASSLPELLADWDVVLRPGERAIFFTIARARWRDAGERRDEQGFLLVTTMRLMLLKSPRPGGLFGLMRSRDPGPMDVAVTIELSEVSDATIRGRRRPELQLDGRLTVSDVDSDMLIDIREHVLDATS